MKLPSINPAVSLFGALISLSFIVGCASHNPALESCIQPCSTHSEADKQISGKLAAKLQQVPEASAEASYKNTIKNDFPQLSDSNARLCLGLRAIECYYNHKMIDKATAQRLAEETLQNYRSRNGVSAVGGKLTPLEKNLVRKSPDGSTIMAELKSFNLAN